MTHASEAEITAAILAALKNVCSDHVLEQAAGLIGVAACRATDKQELYDSLGSLANVINGFRQDLRTVHKVRP
jgi:hypothetical protein